MWKVLIADDEPKIRQGLKSVLEEMKLPITVCAEARNGMEALEKIEQFQPDFILMDICTRGTALVKNRVHGGANRAN